MKRLLLCALGVVAACGDEPVSPGSELGTPSLPATPFAYSDQRRPLPTHYLLNNSPGGSALSKDNQSFLNLVSDAGATLGRVLFHDKRLSVNGTVSCESCHMAQFGFSDTAQFSRGFAGGLTKRHSMGIANARFYNNGRMFWDERVGSLEQQTLMPIQDPVEMGFNIPDLLVRLRATDFYPPLFQAAFSSPEITSERIGRALAQYVRSLVSYGSRFDSSFTPGATNPNPQRLTPQELEGRALFNNQARCAPCHATNAHVSDAVHNTGLDSVVTDEGAGNGRFKAPSLRNVALRGRFMHDGRFTSLEQVVEFYDSGVKSNPFLDARLRGAPDLVPVRLNLTATQRAAIVAYLKTLTDRALITDPRFQNPFRR